MAFKRKFWIVLALLAFSVNAYATGVDSTFRNLAATGTFNAVTGQFTGELKGQPPTISGDVLIWGSPAQLASLVLGAPTGGNQGAGTLNATGIFINGVAVSAGVTPGGATHSIQLNEGGGVLGGLLCVINTVVYGQTSADPICSGSPVLTALTASVNGVIDVTAPPYNALCDSSTDDYTPMQTAIDTSCRGTTDSSAPHPEIYIPYTGHSCMHSAPLHAECGNLAINGPNIGTSAALGQTYVGPAIIAHTRNTSNLEYGPALVGIGQSLNLKSVIDGHGYVILDDALNSALATLNGKSAFNITYKVNIFNLGGSGGDLQEIFSSSNTANAIAAGNVRQGFYTRLNNTGSQFQAGLNFSTTGAVTFPTFAPTINTTFEVSINSDGSGNCQEFIEGVQNGATQTCTGSLVLHPYEVINLPSDDVAYWPDGGNNRNPAWAYIDAIKIEGVSVHTANYTVDNINRPTGDSNTLLLANWPSPTTAQQDTQSFTIGTSTLGLFPVNADQQQMFNQHLSYLELCNSGSLHRASGLYATNVPNSEFDHLTCTDNLGVGIDLHRVIYNSSVHDNSVAGGTLCHFFGTGFSEATGAIQGEHCTQLNVGRLASCYVSNSASFAEIGSACQDQNSPGDLIFPFQDIISHNTHINSFVDSEGTGLATKASFGWISQPYTQETIINPEGNTHNGAPFIIQSGGGTPVHISGLDWASQAALQVVTITSTLNGPDLIDNSILPGNGNRVCTASTVPLACCTGSGTGTCPAPPLSNQPTLVDSIDNVYDTGTPVPNLINNGFNLPSSAAGFLTLGAPGFVCPKTGTANATTVVTAKPTCSQPGVVEVCIAGVSNVPALSIASADGRFWHQIGSTVVDGGDNNSEAAAWWSIAPVNEGSTTITLGSANAIQSRCGVMVGVDSLNPIIASSTAVNGFGGPPRAVTAPAVVTGNVNAYELQFAEFNVSGTGTYTTSGLPTNAQVFQNTTPQPGLIGAVWNATGDPSSTGTYTWSGSASIVSFSIIFNPASTLGVAPALPQNPTHLAAGLLTGALASSISGGGSLSTGSNSFAGTITSAAATGNVLTPGFTCPNAVVGTFQDDTTAGGVKVTAQNATTITFSATASDIVEYLVSCR